MVVVVLVFEKITREICGGDIEKVCVGEN